MKKIRLLSAFLSFAMGLTSFAGVPVSVNAAEIGAPSVTPEVKGAVLVTTEPTTTTSATSVTTTAPTETAPEEKTEKFGFEQEVYNLPEGNIYILKVNNPDRIKLDYEVEDKNIASERIIYPTYVYVNALNTGITKVTAFDEDGNTAEAVINVFSPETTATTTTGTGTVTTTHTETTYIRSTPGAGMSFKDEMNAMYISPNEVKTFEFSAYAAQNVEFKADTEDIKIDSVEFKGTGSLTPVDGKVTISCRYNAEPRCVTLYSYTKHNMTGEYFKSSHDLLIVPPEFVPTTTTTTGTGTSITTTTTTVTYLPTTEVNGTITTAVFCYVPEISGNSTPMMQGESRKIYVRDPQTGKGNNIRFDKYSDNILVEYHDGDDFLIVTALSEGSAVIEGVTADGCAFSTDIKIEVGSGYADYRPNVTFDRTPVRVGEKKVIYFEHPVRGTVKGTFTNSKGDLDIEYSEGNNFVTVTALKEGQAELTIGANGCAFSGFASFEVIPKDTNIITELISAPDKIVYQQGEAPDLKGLKAKVNRPDGTETVIDLSDIEPSGYTISKEKYPYTTFTQEQFTTQSDRLYIALAEGEDGKFVYGGTRYYFYQGNVSFPVYIENAEHKYLELKNARVENASYGADPEGLVFKGMDKGYRIDADAHMYSDTSMSNIPFLKEGDVISGVLKLNANGTYVITGDIFSYGKSYDANCDGEISMGDAVLIMQALANPDKYGVNGTNTNHITELGKVYGDTDEDGMTNLDALAIQKKLLKLA